MLRTVLLFPVRKSLSKSVNVSVGSPPQQQASKDAKYKER